jgi:two-component system, OmpR family, phosphate regulon sensor histidine kinase PhoR
MAIQKPLTKISLILVLIILLPALFFSTYELSSLNENETVIQSIYTNQLDAILFSVNQYTKDILDSWAAKLNLTLVEKETNEEEYSKKMNEFLNLNSSVNYILFADSTSTKIIDIFNNGKKDLSSLNQKDVTKLLVDNRFKTERLYVYKKEGYQKYETINDPNFEKYSMIMFLMNLKYSKVKSCIIIFDPVVYIKQVLAPKLQDVSQDKFKILVFDNKNNRTVYSTERNDSTRIEQRKSFWLLPGYSIGISLKGTTIASLVESRSKFNILLIVALNLILLIGLLFVYKSIRKEIELAQIKSDFVSNVSHELRTPLALISMFAETLELERARTEEKKKEYYKIISQEANRLGKIVNKILNFSKIEAGKIKYHFVVTDLNSFAEDIYNTYIFHLQNNGFQCSFEKGDFSNKINADREALSEAIINLIDNAVKYSNDVKFITIKTGLEKDMVFIEVKDKGIGISKDDQKKIFDKFFRVTTGNIHDTKGTGLGLTLVKHIVNVHKGTITIDSSIGKGSSFRIYLPSVS